jgi:hypothetical protein
MNILKSSLKTIAVAAFSFALGAALFHSPTVKAQGTNVVSIARVSQGTSQVSISPGSQVVGFSCVQTRTGEPMCYVASTGR